MVTKKFFAKALALAMATGLLAVAAPSVAQVWAAEGDAEAKKATPVTAEVCYRDMTVMITSGEDAAGNADNYVFLEVMKKKDDTKEGTVYPFPCNEGVVEVDLSFLKITKESYLRIWGDKSAEKVTLTVSAQPAKIKYKYAAQTFPELKVPAEGATEADKEKIAGENQNMLIKYYADSFGITDTTLPYMVESLYHGTVIRLCDKSYDEYSYYADGDDADSGDGKWDFWIDADQLKNVKVTGTTLVIRQMPVENTYEKDAKGAPTNEIEKAGAPMGPEVKVKIPAAPKAPKVTIDYAKGTVKLPKNAEYGIIEDGKVEYVALAAGGALSPKEILEKIADKLGKTDTEAKGENEAVLDRTNFINDNLDAGFNLVVRTNDAKKGASNPAFVAVKKTVTYKDDQWGKITLTTESGEGGNKQTQVTEIATYEFSNEGVTVTAKVGSFEYEESGKWKKISSGKLIKGKTSELTIRMAGVKDKDETKAAFPSTEMTIKKPVDQSVVEITPTTTKVVIGTSLKLTVTAGTLKDRNGKTQDVATTNPYKWESSDTSIATVAGTTAEGTITGEKAGTCTITVTVTFTDGTTAKKSVEITVEAAPAA